MYLRVNFDNDFEDLILHLRSKYGKEMFDIDGIGKQLDMANFGKQFFSTKLDATADVSVDANANVEDTTVVAYENELPNKRACRYGRLFLFL